LKWAEGLEKAQGKRAIGAKYPQCGLASAIAFHLQASLRNFRTT
jgi:hypothetical protein